ncbi:hypothetical protein A3C23_02090 [Candidatus Roizmanbacteria bacterium RIFCSPHIGHO2_02_FULL_37_13b]|uniref:Phosphatidic acid phosphatase type 2/haloperoxidase domain-containing protein n=1 Tax=Candidatus Roizmanbacteria bacterium RIFCSPLOWO2_02_FULL_36_11 TaxID=1802071 RepID=A0A1F7JGN7_9BACT|nr:MAG: hypothetical protein A3C23_02090 [Candidatus Roizmanbacteria bacterium RIFCSPHIGHO2_02_FULL_37_13b]OGK54778.1 MAG: hypothetical protein A3H78_05840 [Candidatus Roizmanbacteria bacterium RIFCSPLOWO2_02_FULL_36_11]
MRRKKIQEHHLFYATACFLLLILALLKPVFLLTIDKNMAKQFYNFLRNPFISLFLSFITNYTIGSLFFAPLIVTIILFLRVKIKGIIYFFIGFGSLAVIRYLLQSFFGRQRPFVINQNTPYLGQISPYGSSFPSFHAMTAFFVAYFLVEYLRLKHLPTFFLYLLAFLVAVSRVYLGAHFPADVLVGAFIGLLWGHLFFHLSNLRLK